MALAYPSHCPNKKKIGADMSTRILIIDDDVELCEELKDLLADNGFHVSCAYNADQGENMVKDSRFDVIILDNKMNGMSGIDLLKRVDSAVRKKVILVSGKSFIEKLLMDEGLFGAISGTIGKPIDFELLLTKIIETAKANRGLPKRQ
jgi:DNA-binding NtrC family response regulator